MKIPAIALALFATVLTAPIFSGCQSIPKEERDYKADAERRADHRDYLLRSRLRR